MLLRNVRRGGAAMRKTARLLASLCVVACAAATTASAKSPLPNGCPTGFGLISIDAPEDARQAALAGQVDASGNNDGYVCRRALGDGAFHNFPTRPDTVYQ
jgi:hypothetical protein